VNDVRQPHTAGPTAGLLPPATDPGRVSVVIPVYNRRKLLERAVDSIRAQTFGNWEVLIVDDGSSDGSAEFAQGLAAADPRIRSLRNSRGKGPGGARNAGIVASTGGYVAFLDSDDSWLPGKLEAQVRYLERTPGAMAVGTDCFVGATTPDARLSNRYPRIDNSPQSVFATIIRNKQFWIYTPTVLLNRAVFTKIPLFDESLIRCEDLVMWLTLNEKFGWHYVPEALSFINVDPKRNDDYKATDKRVVPEGLFHMRFVREVEKHVSLDDRMRDALRRERRRTDYLYWNGRERLQRKDPSGLLYYAGALGAQLLERILKR
jgi:glycosyltransferase involved in cell wall biosynthesis